MEGDFIFSTASRPDIKLVKALHQRVQRALSPDVKRPWNEPYHSHQLVFEMKNKWI
jgi:hypothetical protein